MSTNSSTSASTFDSIEIFNAIYEEQQELEALRMEMARRYEKEGEALEGEYSRRMFEICRKREAVIAAASAAQASA